MKLDKALDEFVDASFDLRNLVKTVNWGDQSDEWVQDAETTCANFDRTFATLIKEPVVDI